MATAPAIIDIAEAQLKTTKVPTRELRTGMTIWSIWGRPYTLDKIVHFKRGCRTYRSDGEVEWFDYYDVGDGTDIMFTVGLPD